MKTNKTNTNKTSTTATTTKMTIDPKIHEVLEQEENRVLVKFIRAKSNQFGIFSATTGNLSRFATEEDARKAWSTPAETKPTKASKPTETKAAKAPKEKVDKYAKTYEVITDPTAVDWETVCSENTPVDWAAVRDFTLPKGAPKNLTATVAKARYPWGFKVTDAAGHRLATVWVKATYWHIEIPTKLKDAALPFKFEERRALRNGQAWDSEIYILPTELAGLLTALKTALDQPKTVDQPAK